MTDSRSLLRKTTFIVQPWFDEGEDWPEAPGPALRVQALDRDDAIRRYDQPKHYSVSHWDVKPADKWTGPVDGDL